MSVTREDVARALADRAPRLQASAVLTAEALEHASASLMPNTLDGLAYQLAMGVREVWTVTERPSIPAFTLAGRNPSAPVRPDTIVTAELLAMRREDLLYLLSHAYDEGRRAGLLQQR